MLPSTAYPWFLKSVSSLVLALVVAFVVLFAASSPAFAGFLCGSPVPGLTDCEVDSDCVVADGAGCCACNMGGRQIAINADKADEHADRTRFCCGGVACIALYNCSHGLETRCVHGSCELVGCGDGVMEGAEQCDDGRVGNSNEKGGYCSTACKATPCGVPQSGAWPPVAGDAQHVLRASVELADCDMRVCDVNDDGRIVASDAQTVLLAAVKAPAVLECSPEVTGCRYGQCCQPLDSFCVGDACPGVAQAEAIAREAAAVDPAFFCFAQTGRCGDLSVVRWGYGYTGEARFFDADDRLVAVDRSTDYPAFCDETSFSQFYGFVPDCDFEVTEDFCPPPGPIVFR